jgi:hypothetical protein
MKGENMIHLIGAYGRRYESFESVLADWEDGKDFKIVGGPYTSIRDTDSLVNLYDEVVIATNKGDFTVASRQKDLIDTILGK